MKQQFRNLQLSSLDKSIKKHHKVAHYTVKLCIANMSAEQIKNIEDLIPLGDGKKIVDYKIKLLTAPGENSGSLMLKVDFTVKTPTGNEEIHAAAKTVPPNELIQEVFNTAVTFRNEIAFYKKIVPLLQDFQKQHGVKEVIDFVPKYYGSRLNLKGDEGKVDQDAVLLLENLKLANYDTRIRFGRGQTHHDRFGTVPCGTFGPQVEKA
jgi:uncharacterized ubiquitin-like protein YukD